MLGQTVASDTPSATITAAVLALVATIIGGVIAVGWPSWRSWQIGRRFVKLVRRELEEIKPNAPEIEKAIRGKDAPPADKPWWQYLSKRFVHEKFVTREGISDHRDFVLSLDPTLVYLLSQLWSSFEEHDGEQWKYYLCTLADNKKVRSKGLKEAAELWEHIVSTAPRAG